MCSDGAVSISSSCADGAVRFLQKTGQHSISSAGPTLVSSCAAESIATEDVEMTLSRSVKVSFAEEHAGVLSGSERGTRHELVSSPDADEDAKNELVSSADEAHEPSSKSIATEDVEMTLSRSVKVSFAEELLVEDNAKTRCPLLVDEDERPGFLTDKLVSSPDEELHEDARHELVSSPDEELRSNDKSITRSLVSKDDNSCIRSTSAAPPTTSITGRQRVRSALAEVPSHATGYGTSTGLSEQSTQYRCKNYVNFIGELESPTSPMIRKPFREGRRSERDGGAGVRSGSAIIEAQAVQTLLLKHMAVVKKGRMIISMYVAGTFLGLAFLFFILAIREEFGDYLPPFTGKSFVNLILVAFDGIMNRILMELVRGIVWSDERNRV